MDKLAGTETLSVTVNVLAQPGEQGFVIVGRNAVVEIGDVLPGLFEKLCRVQVAEGVGGKIAEDTHGPMDVLQASIAVGRRGNAQKFLHLRIPGLGRFARCEVAGDERPLDLKS